TEEWHEKFMTALRELSVVEYYLDILLFGDRADKEALVKEKWKEVERIEQCEREDKGDRHKRTERCHERNAPDGR
ncbi:MAG TPA: DNA primase, partial [Blautia wexlerae]|nr:DNA primase [Blautia wexlerae]